MSENSGMSSKDEAVIEALSGARSCEELAQTYRQFAELIRKGVTASTAEEYIRELLNAHNEQLKGARKIYTILSVEWDSSG